MTHRAILKSACLKDFKGRVIYSGEKAIDAVGDELAAVLVKDIKEMGPYGILLSDIPRSIEVGSEAVLNGGELVIGDFRIDISAAPLWTTNGITVKTLSQGLLNFMTNKLKELSSIHYAALMRPEELSNAVYRKIGLALLSGRASALNDIVGLGYGMTPSGDDAIVGFMSAVRGHAIVESGAFDRISARTTTLSALAVKCAAAGEIPWRLASLIGAVNLSDERKIALAINELSKAGHSSGLDMLTGFLAGYRSILRTSSP